MWPEPTSERLPGVRLAEVIPASAQGVVSAYFSSGRPLVLIFCPSLAEPECRAYLEKFVVHQMEYRRLDAQVIVVSLEPAAGSDLRFPVIASADLYQGLGLVREHGADAAVMVVDRYGVVDRLMVATSYRDLPGEPRVAQLLQGAESVCPECGTPEGHWVEVSEP